MVLGGKTCLTRELRETRRFGDVSTRMTQGSRGGLCGSLFHGAFHIYRSGLNTIININLSPREAARYVSRNI